MQSDLTLAEAIGKGERTREAILARAIELACRVGLGGLTIAGLATEVGMSKSGMFAHFGSKEALQLAVLDAAAADFELTVVVPALQAPRGEPRLRALFQGWLANARSWGAGGCLFVKVSSELDDQPGPVRDRLRGQYDRLFQTIARIFETGITEGQFRPDADPAQFATDLHGVILAFYHGHRFMRDERAESHARAALDTLLAGVRTQRENT